MTATITFNLPDDEYQHRLAVNAGNLASVVSDANQQMRGWLKYSHPFTTAEQAIEACRALLAEAVEQIQ